MNLFDYNRWLYSRLLLMLEIARCSNVISGVKTALISILEKKSQGTGSGKYGG